MSGLSSFGAILEWYDATNTQWVAVGGVGDIEGPGIEVSTEETTAHDSPNGWEEYVATTINGGEVSFTVNYIPSSASHAWSATGGLPYMAIQRQVQQFRVRFPDPNWNDGGTPAQDYYLQFNALVTEFNPKTPVKGKLEADVTLKVTGEVTEVVG